eukprot:2003774-Rhodomonas_salina.1
MVLWKDSQNGFVMNLGKDGYFKLTKVTKNAINTALGHQGHFDPKSHVRPAGTSNAKVGSSQSTARTSGKMCMRCAFLYT